MKAGNEKKPAQYLGRVLSVIGHLLPAGLILLIVTIVFWGVIARYLPVYGPVSLWVYDAGRAALVWLVFLVGGLMVKQTGHSGEHFVIRIFADHLPARARLSVMTADDILSLIFFGFLLVEGTSYCISVRNAITANVGWPFLVYTVPVVLGSLLAIAFLINRLISTLKKRLRQ